ncbi:TPA: hypothetical protein ACOZ1H_004830, partial [Klebsiella pneumoniae]
RIYKVGHSEQACKKGQKEGGYCHFIKKCFSEKQSRTSTTFVMNIEINRLRLFRWKILFYLPEMFLQSHLTSCFNVLTWFCYELAERGKA